MNRKQVLTGLNYERVPVIIAKNKDVHFMRLTKTLKPAGRNLVQFCNRS